MGYPPLFSIAYLRFGCELPTKTLVMLNASVDMAEPWDPAAARPDIRLLKHDLPLLANVSIAALRFM